MRTDREGVNAFTLLEVLTVVAIIATLTAILLPTYHAVRRRSHQATCTSNLRQLGAARAMYMQDNDETPPRQLDLLWPSYVSAKELFTCPEDQWVKEGGWAWVNWGSGNTPPQNWRIPISYLYVPTLDLIMSKEEQTQVNNPGYAACVLHGAPYMMQPDKPPFYAGTTLRLRFDGSVLNTPVGNAGDFDLPSILTK